MTCCTTNRPRFVPFVAPTEPPQQPVMLRVVEEDGNLYLAVVDDQGDIKPSGRLLKIQQNGTLLRMPNLPQTYGFELTDVSRFKTGKVKIID